MINEQIRDKEVRLIGEEGEQLGIMSSKEALKLAEEAGLDLVQIEVDSYAILFFCFYFSFNDFLIGGARPLAIL